MTDFLYIALLLGGLIFFHEFGHFLLARAMGIHVVTFSIGFGPPLFTLRGRAKGKRPPTEYSFAAFPLGGYVSMLGADPSEEIPEHLREFAFASKKVWRRVLVIFAGPGFNFLLALALFFVLGLSISSHQPSVAGTVLMDGPAWEAGIRAGDRITAIDGEKVSYFWQIQELVSDHEDQTYPIDWEHRGETREAEVTPEHEERPWVPGLDVTRDHYRIGISASYEQAVVSVAAGSPAADAGISTWDRVLSVDGEPVERFDELITRMETAPERPLELVYLHFDTADSSGLSVGAAVARKATLPADEADPLRGIGSAEMVIRRVVPGTPAAKIGLRPGDRVQNLDGQSYPLWGLLRSAMNVRPRDAHVLRWEHDGQPRSASFELAEVAWPIDLKPDNKALVFGASAVTSASDLEPVAADNRLDFARYYATSETGWFFDFNFVMVGQLFSGGVSFKEMGGPILMGQLATRAGERGWFDFFRLMAQLSVGLGIINLLPIPVLDGGQLFFLALEGIRRRPVSLRTRQIATYVGLAFLLVLMILVFKNDIERSWFS